MIGRPASGRARKASISFPRSATIFLAVIPGRRTASSPEFRGSGFIAVRCPGTTDELSPGGEEPGETRPDVFGDLLRGAIFGVAEGARASKPLVGARHVVADPREGRCIQDLLAGCDLDQGELRVERVIFAGREAGQRG